ncbi:MAG: hypothetical protein ABEI53_00665 [Candidatus Magasanikbacteria bacterium]
MSQKQIEVEFRAMFDEKKKEEVQEFLEENGKDLGEDDKDTFFFIMPDKLLKVVNNISKENAKLSLKLDKIGEGSDFEELEFSIPQKNFEKAAKLFKALDISDNVMHSFQERHNYEYRGVELALKYSEEWGHHLELEILIQDPSKKEKAEQKIRDVADELDVHLMTDEELKEFTQKVEKEHKEKNN